MARKKKKNWRKHLQAQRRIGRYEASIEATGIEARLRVRLPAQTWEQVEATWGEMKAEDACLPQQRRDYLIQVADRHAVSLVGV